MQELNGSILIFYVFSPARIPLARKRRGRTGAESPVCGTNYHLYTCTGGGGVTTTGAGCTTTGAGAVYTGAGVV